MILDRRILQLTIFLSLVLLSIAITELLSCFKIIEDVASLADWKFLLYYLFSEQIPTVIITYFLNAAIGGPFESKDNYNSIEGLYSSRSQEMLHSSFMKQKMRKQSRAQTSPIGSDYMAINEIY